MKENETSDNATASLIKSKLQTISDKSQSKEDYSSPDIDSSELAVEPAKKKRGRPTKITRDTKLNRLLKRRGISRNELYKLVEERYPDEPVSHDAISRICNGVRVYYSTQTLFRLCGALNVAPNAILDWEQEVKNR